MRKQNRLEVFVVASGDIILVHWNKTPERLMNKFQYFLLVAGAESLGNL